MRAGAGPLALISTSALACGGLAGPAATPPRGSDTSDWIRIIAPFEVLDERGEPYDHPFLGGFDAPRPQLVDIDGDGDLDLFVQEVTHELVFLERTASTPVPRYEWRTDRYEGLDVGDWSRFVDMDGDGDLDLLTEALYSYIRYYRNDGDARSAAFSLVADSIRDDLGVPIFSDRQNIPSLVDVDCDGTLDLFLGRIDGTLTRLELARFDERGAPVFRHVTDRFEEIEIVAQVGSMRHGANSIAFADVDADGDPDILWGDFFEPGLLLIENTGTCRAPDLDNDPVRFPPEQPIRTSGYNAPVAVDHDADGDLDFLIGVLGGAFNPNSTSSDNLYLVEGGPGGSHSLETRRYLQGIDVGSESIPALADLDGDGDLDLYVSNKLGFSSASSSSMIRFENVGTAREPRFRSADTLIFSGDYHYAPAFADLDGDGDLDLLLGTWNAGLHLYRNVGSRTAPRLEIEEASWIRLTRGSNATPALVDIDADGDLDLFVGEASGTINYYRNEGTSAAPDFVLISDEYGDIRVGRRSFPAFLDVDGDGDPDMVVGSETEGVVLFRNVGTAREPSFARDDSWSGPTNRYAAPAFGDLDGDGVPEAIVGGKSGGVRYYRAGSR